MADRFSGIADSIINSVKAQKASGDKQIIDAISRIPEMVNNEQGGTVNINTTVDNSTTVNVKGITEGTKSGGSDAGISAASVKVKQSNSALDEEAGKTSKVISLTKELLSLQTKQATAGDKGNTYASQAAKVEDELNKVKSTIKNTAQAALSETQKIKFADSIGKEADAAISYLNKVQQKAEKAGLVFKGDYFSGDKNYLSSLAKQASEAKNMGDINKILNGEGTAKNPGLLSYIGSSGKLSNYGQQFQQQLKLMDEYKNKWKELGKAMNEQVKIKDPNSAQFKSLDAQIKTLTTDLNTLRKQITQSGVGIDVSQIFKNFNFDRYTKSITAFADKGIAELNKFKEAASASGQGGADTSGIDALIEKFQKIPTALQNVQKLSNPLSGLKAIQKQMQNYQQQMNELEIFGSGKASYGSRLSYLKNIVTDGTQESATLKSLNNAYQALIKSKKEYESAGTPEAKSDALAKYQSQLEGFKSMASEITALEKKMSGTGTLIPRSKGIVTDVTSAESALRQYATSLGYASAKSITFNEAQNKLVGTFASMSGKTTTITASIDKMSSSLKVSSDAVQKQSSVYAEMGKGLTGFFKTYLTAFTVIPEISSAFKEGFSEFENYEKALTNISYTMDISKKQLNGIGEAAIDQAKDLGMSVDQMEKIYQVYSNMNITPGQLKAQAKPTAILSNLSGEDSSTAADQVQGILNQFGLTNKNSSSSDITKASMHVVDVLNTISANIGLDYSLFVN